MAWVGESLVTSGREELGGSSDSRKRMDVHSGRYGPALRPYGITGSQGEFGFVRAYPRVWRSRENAMRYTQAGLNRPYAETQMLLSKELEVTTRQKALGDPPTRQPLR